MTPTYGSSRTPLVDRLLTVAETAERLAVSRATIYRLFDDGELAPIRIRSDIRVAPEDVADLIERRRAEGKSS
jgi:excisionase family DNA binding protein